MDKLHFIQEQKEHPALGKVATLLLPSGHTVSIREQNGNDDDVLSSVVAGEDMVTPMNTFISGIIIKHDFDLPNENSISTKEVLNMPLRDKYFILMASRIFSISPVIKFKWDWKNNKPAVSYEEDLYPYLWDYNKPLPEPDDPDYFKYRILPYNSKEPFKELTLGQGKVIRYKWLDGHGEAYMVNLPDSKRSINTPLRARFIELKTEDGWIRISDFKDFKPIEMAKIREDIDKNDSAFDGLTDLRNPHTGEEVSIPLLSIPDFFFPHLI